MSVRYQESNPFPRGSVWRRWDLHVHAPEGKLNDNYGKGEEVWERFCAILAASEVEAFGITDYFCADTFLHARAAMAERHADAKKVLFPNIELRLNESLNRENETVELHVLLRHDEEEDTVRKFLSNLETELRHETLDRRLTCDELESPHFAGATVTRESLAAALERTFGHDQIEEPLDYMLIVPANHGGLRSDLGEQRKSALADVIDELAHGFFGAEGNVAHYLDPGRAKGGRTLAPKPVFAGSDAHGFEDLEAWLGREVKEGPTRKSVTWVKADPNFDGLLQTRAEPAGRVRIGALRPDPKEPYRVIESVTFGAGGDFPERIELNQNLVAVIGPRSSGKSSLLAHIAHAIDPEATERAQSEVEPHRAGKLGPAPGVTWDQVAGLPIEVEWVAPEAERGRVIYIPQNALYAISQRRGEITRRIEPAVRADDAELDVAMRQLAGALEGAREQVELALADWFRITAALEAAGTELLDRGDRAAIEARREELGRAIVARREESALGEEEAELYEEVMAELGQIEARLGVIEEESHQLRPHLRREGEELRALPTPSAELRLSPNPAELPEGLRRELLELAGRLEAQAVEAIAAAIVDHQRALDSEAAERRGREQALRAENAELIKKNEMNSEIEDLARSRRQQEEALAQIAAGEERIEGLGKEREEVGGRLVDVLGTREAAIAGLQVAFAAAPRRREPMEFGLEVRFDPDEVAELSDLFARNRKGPLMEAGAELDLGRCIAEPVELLEALAGGAQKLKGSNEPAAVAARILGAAPKALFWAEIEGDRIGGFETSSMSPGKQALFALSLILDDAEEPWPLLIDQPEDDLDSRSISSQLVGYLIARKSERQIIMVSHDANLVIGADAEQVIVANRHGANTQNAGERTFDYFCGSLEHTRPRREDELELERGGIREHSCDILDGGEEAFRKRKRKYKIS